MHCCIEKKNFEPFCLNQKYLKISFIKGLNTGEGPVSHKLQYIFSNLLLNYSAKSYQVNTMSRKANINFAF